MSISELCAVQWEASEKDILWINSDLWILKTVNFCENERKIDRDYCFGKIFILWWRSRVTIPPVTDHLCSSFPLTLQVGIACAAEQQQPQQEQTRKERQSGVPPGLILTGRHYPKNNNGKYIPDNSGKYVQKNVKYIHIAGQKSATAINTDQVNKYFPDNSGSYNAPGTGKYIPRSEGQYVRAKSEGKYPIKTRKTNSVTSRHHNARTHAYPNPTAWTNPFLNPHAPHKLS